MIFDTKLLHSFFINYCSDMFWLQFLATFNELASLWLLNLINIKIMLRVLISNLIIYEGWNFNSGNYLFTTDTK